MENFYVYRTNRGRDNFVRQTDVRQKSKKISLWIDGELNKRIEGVAKELNQSNSKVIKDILEDFFLEQKLRDQAERDNAWKKEVDEWKI